MSYVIPLTCFAVPLQFVSSQNRRQPLLRKVLNITRTWSPSRARRSLLQCRTEADYSSQQTTTEDTTLDTSEPSPVLNDEGEPQDLETLASSGKSSIREIGNTVQEDLATVSSSTEEFANEMIAQETNALLSKYDEKQEEILAAMKCERLVIEQQMRRIEQLAEQAGKQTTHGVAQSNRAKVLTAIAGLLSLAAVLYAWNGFVDADTTELRNSGINAILAACAVYFLQREEAGHTDDELEA